MALYGRNPTWRAYVGYAPGQREREREREKEVGLTYQENLQSCREFRGGRRALRSLATAPVNRIPISRFPVPSPASGGSLSPRRCVRAGHKSRRSGETSLRWTVSGRRWDCHSSDGTSVGTQNVCAEYRTRGSARRDPIDIDGFSPPRSCSTRSKVAFL